MDAKRSQSIIYLLTKLELEKQKNWEWVNNKEIIFLQSKILSNLGFENFFFTRSNNKNQPSDFLSLLRKNQTIHYLNQVHGNRVINASEALQKNLANADGLISDKKNQSLWIYSADCAPVLFVDKFSRKVAACHAGWKGVANRIIVSTLNKISLKKSNQNNIAIAIGPAISAKHYEVGIEVIKLIYESLNHKGNEDKFDPEKHVTKLESMKIIKSNTQSKKINLDIRAAIKEQLLKEGIKESQISICPICTFSESSLFFSKRRCPNNGIQWSAISN